MSSNATFTKSDGNKGTLTFEISVEQANKGIDKAFKETIKTIAAPGFRKGKMPKQMFLQKYGEESLYNDALNNVLPDIYPNAVAEAGIIVVGEPKIDVVSIKKGEPWVMKAEVEIAPEVELGQYKDIEIASIDTTVSEEEINQEIERLRDNQGELVLAEDKIAEHGNTVVIDYTGSVDGVEFEGGKGNNFNLELGSGQFIPGFEDQIVGHKADETFDVNVTFPEQYQAENLAGKEAKFVTTIHEIKIKELGYY